jgi:hypothetical protein
VSDTELPMEPRPATIPAVLGMNMWMCVPNLVFFFTRG